MDILSKSVIGTLEAQGYSYFVHPTGLLHCFKAKQRTDGFLTTRVVANNLMYNKMFETQDLLEVFQTFERPVTVIKYAL